MKKRDFLKTSVALASATIIPSPLLISTSPKKTTLRTAHIGVGGMGASDLESISSHKSVQVLALCDVDKNSLDEAQKKFPNAKVFKDYRIMLSEMSKKRKPRESPKIAQAAPPTFPNPFSLVSKTCENRRRNNNALVDMFVKLFSR